MGKGLGLAFLFKSLYPKIQTNIQNLAQDCSPRSHPEQLKCTCDWG